MMARATTMQPLTYRVVVRPILGAQFNLAQSVANQGQGYTLSDFAIAGSTIYIEDVAAGESCPMCEELTMAP